MPNKIIKIAVVGMGVAGISVLREWTKYIKDNPKIEITLFGDEKTFGRGNPYQKDDNHLLMNVRGDSTTIIPSNKDDFADWLKRNKEAKNPELHYYPRSLVGKYLKEHMELWVKESKAKIIKEKVKSIRVLKNDRYMVKSSSIESEFDVVHLCLGHLPYKDPYNLIFHPNFIINPFPLKEKMPQIPKGSKVAVLGMGLTSIDVLRYIHFLRNDLSLSFFSRTGTFKTVNLESIETKYQWFTKENIEKIKKENHGFIPLKIYLDWFKKETENQGLFLEKDWIKDSFGSKESIKKQFTNKDYRNKLTIIQNLLINMGMLLTDLWEALSEKDKKIFLDYYHTKWDKLRSPFPSDSGKIILSAAEKNKINIFGGLKDITFSEHSFNFHLENEKTQKADYIINATGPEKKVSFNNKRAPLLSQLLNERILQEEKYGGVQVLMPSLSAISQKYGELRTLKVHGQMISGIQFGNNSIDIISESARNSVKDIVNYMFS